MSSTRRNTNGMMFAFVYSRIDTCARNKPLEHFLLDIMLEKR